MNIEEAEKIWNADPGIRQYFFVDSLNIIHARPGGMVEMSAWDGVNAEITVQEAPNERQTSARRNAYRDACEPLQGILEKDVFFTEEQALVAVIATLDKRIENINAVRDHHQKRLEQLQ